MKYNLSLSILTGLIIGAFLGALFFIVPAKLLISGPIPIDVFWLPPGVQEYVLSQTFKFGVIPGLIIGFLGGLNNSATLPRGHLSKAIGTLSYVVCTILAWITQWHYLGETSGKRIAIIILATVVMFFSSIYLSGTVSFIEKIREGGGIND